MASVLGQIEIGTFKLCPANRTDLTITSTVAVSTGAFSTAVRTVRLVSDIELNYAVGSTVTATASSSFLPANTREEIGVASGEQISAVASAGVNGFLNVTEMVTV